MSRHIVFQTALFLTMVFSIQATYAEVRLAAIFTDHMVLQQQMPIPVWGTAAPEEKVMVTFNDRAVTTVANAQGRFSATFPAMRADGASHTLKVTGTNTIELKDVLLGEVWICSGQSNMGRPVTSEQIANSDYPQIRLFNSSGQTPKKDDLSDPHGWLVASPETIKTAGDHLGARGRRGFTEVGWVFGLRLHKQLKTPVGLIQVNCGGSTAKDWTPLPELANTLKWNEPMQRITHQSGVLYEIRLRAIVPFATRGVVWYQGEDDGRNSNYALDFKHMIEAWRSEWKHPDLPFYFAQIAPTTYASGMLRVWPAQQWVMNNVPHTGMAVSNDIYTDTKNGGFKERIDPKTNLPIAGGSNPHPTGKDLIARRLADIALVKTYAQPKRPIYGPCYDSHEIVDGKVRVKFKHVYDGLKTVDDQTPNWFEISSGEKDRNKLVFVKAEAKIIAADTIELSSPEAPRPQHARFGWHPLARYNLVNSAKLPAVSFTTER